MDVEESEEGNLLKHSIPEKRGGGQQFLQLKERAATLSRAVLKLRSKVL